MNRQEKQIQIDELAKAFTKAQVAFCADYRGLTVSKVTGLRMKLSEKGARARVVKNTLAKISVKKACAKAEESEVNKFLGLVTGTTMVVFSDVDPIGPAKVMADFAKANQNLQIRGGWFEGRFLSAQGVDELSKMPGREETLAKLLALINTPATQLLRLMNTPGTQTVQVLEGHRSNLEKKG